MVRLKTRGPELGEPPTPIPIYVRLGMTKGALIAVLVLIAGAIAGFVRLETVAADQRHLLRQTRVIVRDQAALNHRQQVLIAQLRATQRQNRNALREVCRQGQTIAGLVEPIVELFKFDLKHAAIPASARPVYEQALTVFQGYALAQREQPACNEVLRP